jgi:hypothetical protein
MNVSVLKIAKISLDKEKVLRNTECITDGSFPKYYGIFAALNIAF